MAELLSAWPLALRRLTARSLAANLLGEKLSEVPTRQQETGVAKGKMTTFDRFL
jgi:hypothetical protein